VVLDNHSMLRDKNLVPLSRQHQHALALCVRINRAMLSSPEELQAWQAEIQQHFQLEIQYHFAAEEADLFPVARRYSKLAGVVDELITEHAVLRDYFARATARSLDQQGLRQFGEALSAHVRKEERQLFEGIQEYLTPEELAQAGIALDRTLAAASDACIVPTETTLRNPRADH
jgi:hemerythrin-like domain-containing protein